MLIKTPVCVTTRTTIKLDRQRSPLVGIDRGEFRMRKRITFLVGLLLNFAAQALLPPLLLCQLQTAAASQEMSFNRAWGEQSICRFTGNGGPGRPIGAVHESSTG